MNIIALILAICAGFTFLAGAIQGLVAWHSADHQAQKRLRSSIIGCVLLAAALVGASYYVSAASLPSSQKPLAATPPPASDSTLSTSSQKPTPRPSPTPVLTPTSTPEELTVNRQLACTSGSCSYDIIHITVISFSIDTNLGQTSMRFLLASYKDCSSGSFYQLNFQDETNNTYSPVNEGINDFSIAKGQSLTLTNIYSFVPPSGSIYTLSTKFFCGMVEIDYGEVQFTF